MWFFGATLWWFWRVSGFSGFFGGVLYWGFCFVFAFSFEWVVTTSYWESILKGAKNTKLFLNIWGFVIASKPCLILFYLMFHVNTISLHYNIPDFLCLLIHKVTGAISAGGWHPVARERANFSFKILRDDWLHFVLKINNLSDVSTLRNPCESLT